MTNIFKDKFNKTRGNLLFPIVLTTALFYLGCGDLDISNPNAPVIEDAPVQTLITGAEAGMRTSNHIYLWVVSAIGRESYYFEPADPRYTGELLENTIDPGGFLLNSPWSSRYNVIANCNILLNDKLPDLEAADAAGVEGFAKTITAYQLLLNLNLLNETGIKIDFSGDLTVPFASRTESLARIVSLLDEGNSALDKAGGSFKFFLSSGFAGFDTPSTFAQFNRAIKARVSIYQGNHAEALTALGGSFISTSGDLKTGVYHVYSTGLGDQTNNVFETPDAPFIKWMGHPTHEADAEAGDTRYTSKIVVRSDTTVFDFLTSTLGITIVSSVTDPLPIIRNEELILLRAEANIGLGNYSTAEADINVIRAAAGLADSPTLDATNALDQLLHEKRYSLFLEGYRWVDMRLYGKLGDLPIDRAGDVMIINFPKPETETEG